jgi:hypothetical protein
MKEKKHPRSQAWNSSTTKKCTFSAEQADMASREHKIGVTDDKDLWIPRQ